MMLRKIYDKEGSIILLLSLVIYLLPLLLGQIPPSLFIAYMVLGALGVTLIWTTLRERIVTEWDFLSFEETVWEREERMARDNLEKVLQEKKGS